jgi:hypothetical protein
MSQSQIYLCLFNSKIAAKIMFLRPKCSYVIAIISEEMYWYVIFRCQIDGTCR